MAGSSLSALFTTKGIAALLVGGAAIVGGGYLIKNDQGQPIIQSLFDQSQPATGTETTAEPKMVETAGEAEQQTASLENQPETPAPAAEPAPEAMAGPKPPAFDLLRVEKDGSLVVAGTAPAGSDIEIIDNGQAIASGRAAGNGDFAIVLDTPLAPGDHQLSIIATTDDGDRIASVETGIITIPGADEPQGEVLAMVQTEGEATRIMQKPETLSESKPAAEPAPEQAAEASPEPASKPQVAEQPVSSGNETASSESMPVPQASPGAGPEKSPEQVAMAGEPVRVEAVDVEAGRMFVAGKGEPGNRVRIYIDNEFMGQTRIGPEGAFLLEIEKGLTGGNHTLRADMLPTGTNDVASRASVIVEHQPEPMKVAEAPTPEPVQEPKADPAASGQSAAEPVMTEQQPVAEPVTEPAPAKTAEAPMPAEEAIPVIQTGRSVIIRRGDNLWRISRRLLGEGRKYTVIFAANDDQIEDPDLIFPGQVFDVPGAEPEAPAAASGNDKTSG